MGAGVVMEWLWLWGQRDGYTGNMLLLLLLLLPFLL